MQSVCIQTGQVLGFFCIEFHQNMIASGLHFGYQMLLDLLEIWHIDSQEYLKFLIHSFLNAPE